MQTYGLFYATSFLELYRNPQNITTMLHNITVIVNRDEQYLFLVRGFVSPRNRVDLQKGLDLNNNV